MCYVSRYLTQLGYIVRIACGGKDYPGTPSQPKWSSHNLDFEGIPVSRIVRNTSRMELMDSYVRQDPERYALWQKLFFRFEPDLVFTVGRSPALMGDVEKIARIAQVPVVATLIHPDQVCPKGTRFDAWGNGCMRTLDSEICGECVVRSSSPLPGLNHILNFHPAAAMTSILPKRGLFGRLQTAFKLPSMVAGFVQYWDELRDTVSVFVVHSQEAMELVLANGVPIDKIRFSVPGLEPRTIAPRIRKLFRPVRFGFVGRPCAEKGVHTLLDAWQLLEPGIDVELHLWGNPQSGEPDIVKRIETLVAIDTRVKFHGPFARNQTDAVYDSMDVLVVPSLWFDNCPFVISEAFAAGVPAVGSDFGGIKSMIRNGVDGLLAPMGDAQALGNILIQLATDPEMTQNLTDNVRPPRDAADHVKDLRELFDSLCAVI